MENAIKIKELIDFKRGWSERDRRIVAVVKNAFRNPNQKQYCGYYSGCGRHMKAINFQDVVIEYLKYFGVKYEFGNDAPRGGVTGNYIIVKDNKLSMKWSRIEKLTEILTD